MLFGVVLDGLGSLRRSWLLLEGSCGVLSALILVTILGDLGRSWGQLGRSGLVLGRSLDSPVFLGLSWGQKS